MQQPAPNQATELEYQEVEDVEEVNPLTVIQSLERDNEIMLAALRKILRTNPAAFKGGPSNQYFGRRHEQAFEQCRETAFKALERLENHLNDKES